jgi:hypothetical protein
MPNELLSANQLSLVISQAAAPAFLLAAVASFLSVLVGQMSRIADHLKVFAAIPETDSAKSHPDTNLQTLKKRAALIHHAIYWAVGSGILTCLLMIVAFGAAYLGIRHEPAAALLFILSLSLFTVSLISFALEVRATLNKEEFI